LLNIAAFLVISLVYLWTFYNLPILLVGVRSLRREKKRQVSVEGELPFISIIVPVKNEARVVGRLLSALEGLDYPRDRREFIVVEDGSEDGSLEICERFSSEHGDVVMVSLVL
jgi:cellulose synthase/poly-beta-1,6-N-acetylglucosamine synthase-like glycosyltransferase